MTGELIFIIILLLSFLLLLFFLKLAASMLPPLPHTGRGLVAECLKAVADSITDEPVKLVSIDMKPLPDGRCEIRAELANSVMTIMYYAICSQGSSSENIKVNGKKVMMDFLNGAIVCLQTPFGKRYGTKSVKLPESNFAYEIWRIVRNQISQPKLG